MTMRAVRRQDLARERRASRRAIRLTAPMAVRHEPSSAPSKARSARTAVDVGGVVKRLDELARRLVALADFDADGALGRRRGKSSAIKIRCYLSSRRRAA